MDRYRCPYRAAVGSTLPVPYPSVLEYVNYDGDCAVPVLLTHAYAWRGKGRPR